MSKLKLIYRSDLRKSPEEQQHLKTEADIFPALGVFRSILISNPGQQLAVVKKEPEEDLVIKNFSIEILHDPSHCDMATDLTSQRLGILICRVCNLPRIEGVKGCNKVGAESFLALYLQQEKSRFCSCVIMLKVCYDVFTGRDWAIEEFNQEVFFLRMMQTVSNMHCSKCFNRWQIICE